MLTTHSEKHATVFSLWLDNITWHSTPVYMRPTTTARTRPARVSDHDILIINTSKSDTSIAVRLIPVLLPEHDRKVQQQPNYH